MNTRSERKKGEGDIVEGDIQIDFSIRFKKKRELTKMVNKGGATNVEKKIFDLITMSQKISLQF